MPPRRREIDTTAVVKINRQEFISEYWDYHAGQHVTVLAPTGGGKTQLAYQLLGATATPDLPATVLVMKPRDETVTKFSKQYGFRIVRDWPPPVVQKLQRKPPGYVLWPKESGDFDISDYRMVRSFKRAIQGNYRKGDCITFADETYSLEKEMGLSRDLVRVWTKGRSMGNGLWAASQRPAWISLWAYQAHHLFIANDPDINNQKRYGEIGGGIDPDLVRAITGRLQRYQFLYINREERTICIVDK